MGDEGSWRKTAPLSGKGWQSFAKRLTMVKARLGWGLVVLLFLVAYIFFAMAFALVRIWLWASAAFWELTLKWRGFFCGGPYEGLLPSSLREPGVEERIEELIAKNREILERYGWLP